MNLKYLNVEELGNVVRGASLSNRTSHTLARVCARNDEELNVIALSDALPILTVENFGSAQMERYIRDLSREALDELVAIMLIGRGDREPREFDSLTQNIARSADTYSVDYVCSKSVMLPQYLTKGLMLLRDA